MQEFSRKSEEDLIAEDQLQQHHTRDQVGGIDRYGDSDSNKLTISSIRPG